MTAVVTRARLDAELVRRGLARSRQQAAELIEQGRVAVRGVPAGKPATVVDRDTPVTVRETGERDWASRGAHKLIGALDAFGVDVAGARCLDAGASTGGFTDVLLDRGRRAGGGRRRRLRPAGVAAAQRRAGAGAGPHQRARPRPRTTSAARSRITVADLSFISLRTVLPALAACTSPDGELLPMVKPQFEVGRDRLGAGGVVRDPELRLAALTAVAAAARGTRAGRCAARWPARCRGRRATSSTSCGSPGTARTSGTRRCGRPSRRVRNDPRGAAGAAHGPGHQPAHGGDRGQPAGRVRHPAAGAGRRVGGGARRRPARRAGAAHRRRPAGLRRGRRGGAGARRRRHAAAGRRDGPARAGCRCSG